MILSMVEYVSRNLHLVWNFIVSFSIAGLIIYFLLKRVNNLL